MSKVQPLSSQLPSMPVTFPSPLPQSQPHCRYQQPLSAQKDASTTTSLSITHSRSLSSLFLVIYKLSATAIVCHRTNNHDCIIPSPLISIIDPLHLRHNFLPSPLSFHLQFQHVAVIVKSATNNILFTTCPKPPQNFQILLKYLNLTILNLIFYLFNAYMA